jgi:hypothetical protein
MRILIQILLADFGRVAVLAKLNTILSFYVKKNEEKLVKDRRISWSFC